MPFKRTEPELIEKKSNCLPSSKKTHLVSETDKQNEGQKMMFQVNRFLEQAVIAVIISEQENNQK